MNEEFDDIGVLTILQHLTMYNMHRADKDELVLRLRSDWGRKIAGSILANEKISEDDRSILRRFSLVF